MLLTLKACAMPILKIWKKKPLEMTENKNIYDFNKTYWTKAVKIEKKDKKFHKLIQKNGKYD